MFLGSVSVTWIPLFMKQSNASLMMTLDQDNKDDIDDVNDVYSIGDNECDHDSDHGDERNPIEIAKKITVVNVVRITITNRAVFN